MENEIKLDPEHQYLTFLNDEHDGGKYYRRTKKMIDKNKRRLFVDIDDLRQKKPGRALSLLKNAFEELAAFQKAAKEYVAIIDPCYSKQHEVFFVGFEGNFGNKHLSPRSLTSKYLRNLVCVEGVVTKCSLSKLQIIRSVHYCPATQKFMERKYVDMTSTNSLPSTPVYLTKDDAGNILETEFGLSTYRDHQMLTIQEMPEKAPPGQLPRSVDIICNDDLVDVCKPGDRIEVVGCFRCIPGKHGSVTTGIFRTVIIANSIRHLTVEAEMKVTREDMARLKKLAKRTNIFNLLTRSLAPSIHGHDYVKRAILCLLIGGNEKILKNGTRLRGDINILLIGDPSVAKSQLLRYVLQTAPRAVPTTGRGSSGVGLTAAVTTDPETGERRLEAGAMVLADRGVVCIDEFDKMTDIDRTAIHEVMEQGKVTIAKAGIHVRLNARCSVLAAANPVYGKYDPYKTPMENIGLQDSLLSRFDLLFVLLDLVDTDNDKKISDHVVRMHRYRNPKELDGDVLPMDDSIKVITNRPDNEKDEKEDENRIFEKYDPVLHGPSRSRQDQVMNITFMKKYILLCKNLQPPVLSEEAAEIISEEYSRMRSQDIINTDIARTQPITARTLETLIRLATAHAKGRFSRTVDVADARAAIDLVQYAMFRKVLDRKDKRQVPQVEQREEQDSAEVLGANQSEVNVDEASDDESPVVHDLLSSQETNVTPKKMKLEPKLTGPRLKEFRELISRIFSGRVTRLPVSSVENVLLSPSYSFTKKEIEEGFQKLCQDNVIMIANDMIYLI